MKRLIALGALALAVPAAAQEAPAPAPAQAPARVTALLGPALNVADVPAMKRFYIEGLGMKLLMEMGQPKRHETMLGYEGSAGSPGLILMSDATVAKGEPKTHGTAFDRLVMRVVNLPAVVARLRQLGYTSSDVRGGGKGYAVAMATDPEGNRLELVEAGAKGN